MRTFFCLSCHVILLLLTCAPRAGAAVTFTTTHGVDGHELDHLIADDDLINGVIGFELSGGWHPANTDPKDQIEAFTDGAGALSTLTGLLNDFPGAGTPAKIVIFDFTTATDIGGINIFTGNANDSDGRIFSTSVIQYSTDNGFTFNTLGYFQSDPSGTINNPLVPTPLAVTLVEIFDDSSEVLLSGVTNLQFDLYAVDNTGGEMRDPFDGENPFTLLDDGLTAAFVSPLVWEIDVLAPSTGAADADFDNDNDVDGNDFLIWQQNTGAVGTGTLATGDANNDTNVNIADYDVWVSQFGTGGGAAAVPEPHAICAAVIFATALAARARFTEKSSRAES